MFGGNADDDDESVSRLTLNGERSPAPSIRGPPMSPESADGHESPVFDTRASVISLRELEFGWSTNASGVQRKPTIQRTSPVIEPAAPPARKTYRPPFAPKVSDPFDSATTEDVVPTLSQTGAADAEVLDSGKLAAPAGEAAGLQRGRSIKDRVSNALRSKSKSGRSLSVGARPTAHDAEAEGSHPPATATTPTDEKLSFVGELVRRVSRRQTTARPRRADTDVNGYRPSLDSRLSRADLKQPQHANIVLYAAPAEAGIKNAPALSSYAPRPPLRPRAQSAETIGARTAADYDLPPSPAQPPLVYSATLGQVATEYRARRANTLASVQERGAGRSAAASRNRESGGLAPDASTASRRAERRSKLMQEGWSTRTDVEPAAAEVK